MVDFQAFKNLVSPIIVIACLIIGYILKNAVPNKEINKFIPLIVSVSGIILNCWALGVFNFETVIAGAASGLASTGAYEAFKNLIEMANEKQPTLMTGKHLK